MEQNIVAINVWFLVGMVLGLAYCIYMTNIITKQFNAVIESHQIINKLCSEAFEKIRDEHNDLKIEVNEINKKLSALEALNGKAKTKISG